MAVCLILHGEGVCGCMSDTGEVNMLFVCTGVSERWGIPREPQQHYKLTGLYI